MAGFKILREEPKHFVAHNGAAEFRIAKKGLTEKKAAHFQALCHGGAVKPAKMAKGGEVKAETKESHKVDLAAHKLIREDEHSFHVEGPTGAFRIAKAHVGPALTARIREHFAKGGEVKGYSEGDEIPRDPGLDMILRPDTVTPEEVASLPPADFTPHLTPGQEAEARIEEALRADPTGTGAKMPEAPPAPEPAPPTPEEAAARTHPVTPRLPAGVPDPAQYVPPTVIQPAAASASPAAPQVPGSGVAARSMRDLDTATNQEEAALQERARIQAEEANKAAQIQEEANKQRAAISAQYQQRYSDWQARGEEMFKAVQDAKVDPKRLWSTASTGQKVAASIGMILGGIGAGLTKGPNYAVQIIEKAIDRDVAAQELEVKKKENLLRYHLEQGNEMRSAHLLTKADLLDATAGQLQLAALKAAGPKAQQDALLQSAELRKNAAGLRVQIAAHGQQMALQGLEAQMKTALFPLQVQQAKQQVETGDVNLRMAKAQGEALNQIMSHTAGKGGGLDPRVLEMPGMEKYRERSVQMPGGAIAFARTPKDAEEVKQTYMHADVVKSKLRELDALAAKHGYSGITRAMNAPDWARAQQLRSDILSELGHLHDLNRLSDRDLELFHEQVPDITKYRLGGDYQRALISGLADTVHGKVMAVNRNYLSVGGR